MTPEPPISRIRFTAAEGELSVSHTVPTGRSAVETCELSALNRSELQPFRGFSVAADIGEHF